MVKRTISRQQLWIVTLIFFAPLTFGQSTKPTAIPQAEAQSTFEQGVNALKQGDLDTARTAFEKVLRLSPRHPEAHNLLGWILLKQGDADGSIAQYSKAIQLKPNFAEAHINLANALVQKHDLDGALHEARVAVRLFPDNAEANRALGRILSFRGDLPGATA